MGRRLSVERAGELTERYQTALQVAQGGGRQRALVKERSRRFSKVNLEKKHDETEVDVSKAARAAFARAKTDGLGAKGEGEGEGEGESELLGVEGGGPCATTLGESGVTSRKGALVNAAFNYGQGQAWGRYIRQA